MTQKTIYKFLKDNRGKAFTRKEIAKAIYGSENKGVQPLTKVCSSFHQIKKNMLANGKVVYYYDENGKAKKYFNGKDK